jgi:hypothetical protein
VPDDPAISSAARSIRSSERLLLAPGTLRLDQEKFHAVVDEIRSGVLPDDQAVAATLAEHLENRFAGLDGALAFIMENLDAVPNEETALEESQRYVEPRQAEEPQRPAARLPSGPIYVAIH